MGDKLIVTSLFLWCQEVVATDYSDGLVHGHPPGGITVIRNVKFEKYIKPLDLNLDWCIAVEIIIGTKKCVICNVYMLYQCSDNEPSYLEKLGVIKAINY